MHRAVFKTSLSLTCLLLARIPEAWAAAEKHAEDAAHGHADAHGAEGGVGLPQFDPSTFSSQVIWLAVTFAFLYIFFARKTLPEIFSVIEGRQEHIQNDLETAEKLRKEAEAVQKAYEEDLENARQQSTSAFAEVDKAIKEKTDAELKAFQKRSMQQTEKLEKDIAKAKQAAMEDMNTLAAEIASKAAEKIIGVETDIDQARSVVDSIHGGNAKAA